MNYDIIAAYLAGECTPKEQQEVSQWIDSNPENKQLFQRYQLLWQASRRKEASYEPDMARAWQRIKPVTETSLTGKVMDHRQPFFAWWRRLAAVLLVGLLLGAGLYVYQPWASSTTGWTVITTHQGQKSSVHLADGTVVWLNANSQLRYPEAFEKTQREVFLEGEAFFEVAKDAHKPFLIQTGQTVTRVLGTSFDICGYEANKSVQVVVVTGRVSFTHEDKPGEGVILTSGQKAVWDRKAPGIAQSNNNNLNFLSWKTGQLAFHHALLREVLPTLERHFGVSIRVKNPLLLNCQFTGIFQEAKLEKVLEVFAYGSGITYQKEVADYILDGKGCPVTP